MRWLADENIPGYAIAYLREHGQDVLAIVEGQRGITDIDVLVLERRENRLLLSFDRDHGDLVFNHGLTPPRGIVFLRFCSPIPELLYGVLSSLIALGEAALDGLFTVITPEGSRQRPLKPAAR